MAKQAGCRARLGVSRCKGGIQAFAVDAHQLMSFVLDRFIALVTDVQAPVTVLRYEVSFDISLGEAV